MRREDRQLLATLARVNTALPAFAQRVMDNTATIAEHHGVAEHVIALGHAIHDRARTVTVIDTETDTVTDARNVAAARALSALVDMADALNQAGGGARPAAPCL